MGLGGGCSQENGVEGGLGVEDLQPGGTGPSVCPCVSYLLSAAGLTTPIDLSVWLVGFGSGAPQRGAPRRLQAWEGGLRPPAAPGRPFSLEAWVPPSLHIAVTVRARQG